MAIFDDIANAAARSGRDPGEVTVVAVSKTRTVGEIEEAIRGGISHIGENKVQEASHKIQEVHEQAVWHLVGHLQSNKINRAAGLFDWIQSIDSPKTADMLSVSARNAPGPINILVQVNISGEDSKSGIEPARANDLVSYIGELTLLRVRGLMSIGTFGATESETHREFERMRRLYDDIRSGFQHAEMFDTLSMGMSGDFPAAIEEGATMVRIGTAIFGERS
jgi:pyridoxal phosphate enzyme (YggS family)